MILPHMSHSDDSCFLATRHLLLVLCCVTLHSGVWLY